MFNNLKAFRVLTDVDGSLLNGLVIAENAIEAKKFAIKKLEYCKGIGDIKAEVGYIDIEEITTKTFVSDLWNYYQ